VGTGAHPAATRAGKFGGGSYTASGGLHGVGASVVNALSARLDIEVDREGHTWATSFRRGVAGRVRRRGAERRASRSDPACKKAATIAARKTGTRIRFWPDRQVFLRDATFNYDALEQRGTPRPPTLSRGLAIAIRAEPGAPRRRGPGPAREARAGRSSASSAASASFCHHLSQGEAGDRRHPDHRAGQFHRDRPGTRRARAHDPDRKSSAPWRWTSRSSGRNGYDTITKSFVKRHRHARTTALTSRASIAPSSARSTSSSRRPRSSGAGDEPVIKEDVLEGMTAVCLRTGGGAAVSRGRPRRYSAPRRPPGLCSRSSAPQLKDYLENPPRGCQGRQARAVLDKIAAAAKTRIAGARAPREPAAQDRAGQLHPADEARGLPCRR